MKKCSDVQLSTLSDDPFLEPYLQNISRRQEFAIQLEERLTGGRMSLTDFASGHEYFGLHFDKTGWTFREWAPNAQRIYLVGQFSDWNESEEFALENKGHGVWELHHGPGRLGHGDLYRLRIHWNGGQGDRIPAYARRVVQDANTGIFNAQTWTNTYKWKHGNFSANETPLIYEAHVGMAQEKEGVGTYTEFRENVLPRIIESGYNTIQLMAIMEHPYYGSFGYQVSNFFAASSRFGTPEELKLLIDEAHGAGITVIMDLVHSHAVKNEVEGLSRFDGTLYQYFHDGPAGNHPAWDSRCFDYGKAEVLHFLLSNCRFWLDEYRIDGFRFDGITSMLYSHHGLGPAFDNYSRYFDESVDEEAVAYLTLANKLIHKLRPDAVTIAEDVSGMPGLAAPVEGGGCGFNCRLAMGVPDCWFKLVNDTRDENWDMGYLWHELTNKRVEEKTISYTECHDQAMVGGKSLIFEMIDADIYNFMRASDKSLTVERGMALHKMIRLATLASANQGYLNFMGNEFGHPEWIDFPREGNNWSYHYARRQWSLRDNVDLKYHYLADFDKVILRIVGQSGALWHYSPRLITANTTDKIISFVRGDMLFFFNFHPEKSFTDYKIEVPPGEYQLLIDTDEPSFGGMERIQKGQHYLAQAVKDHQELRHFIQIYLPCRTALVIKKI